MSHFETGLLSRYNSLMDPHLAAYFQNPKMRRQLRKNGLITKNGEIISEASYRQVMARKEHQKHVRELLAQAIVHKTLDMERTRQVEIKKKLEEIAKIELVRRVKGEPSVWAEMVQDLEPKKNKRKKRVAQRNNVAQTSLSDFTSGDDMRRGDEDILPYLSPRRTNSRPSSVPAGKTGRRKFRPLVTDEHGMPMSPSDQSPDEARPKGRGKKKRYPAEIDDKHLYALDSQALREYTMTMNQTRGGPSPYLGPDLVPTPPATSRLNRRRIQHTDRLGRPVRSRKAGLVLHRPEPAMRHQERVQTLCHITLHYFGSHLKLDYERLDPRDEVIVEQQHCGGNTLTVFREKILSKSDFTFVSRRHRGYPFSLTIYIEGKVDCRLSTCCEYKHGKGSRLGGAQGHFGVVHIDGAAPCYRCQINDKVKRQEEKKKRKEQRAREEEAAAKEKAAAEQESSKADYSDDEDHDSDSERSEDEDETPRRPEPETEREIRGLPDEEEEESSSDDDYSSDDDFDDEEKASSAQRSEINDGRASRAAPRARSRSRSRSRSSSRSRSRSSSGSSSRSSSGERTKRVETPPKTPASPAFELKNNAPSSDEEKTPRTAKSSSSSGSSTGRSTDTDTDRGVDSDRKRPPTSIAMSPIKEKEREITPTPQKRESIEKTPEQIATIINAETVENSSKEIAAIINAETEKKTSGNESDESRERKNVIVKGMAPEYSEDESEEPTPRVQKQVSGSDTEHGSGEGGDDTLKALTDEMAKVLETTNKEESPVEKSDSHDSSSDSSSSSSSDSDSDSEDEKSSNSKKKETKQQTTTDQETSDYAGGNDPDRVASDSSQPATHLTNIGVTPGPRHEGSIRPLVEGKRDIELTSLTLSEDQVAELGDILRRADDVESLVLRNSGITDQMMKDLNYGLQRNKSLKMVNLNCNKLTDAEQISELLMYPKSVEILLLHGNPLGDAGIKQLASSLISLHRSAASDEQMVDIRRKAKDVVADVMYDALHSSSLESIVTAGSSASTEGSIAKLLAESERLTASNLSGLALKQLDVGDCQMTSTGATAMAEVIAHSLPIENLSMTGNKEVDIMGWDAIAEALKVNTVLTTLSLDYNNLGDGGAAVISEAIAENKSLKSIDLEGNKIGEEGARKILEAIRKRPNVQDITLMPGNNIPPSLLQEIKEELSSPSRR